ncbi:MAG: matrixin family metalloprotease [Gemmatimonadota bacterium]
MNTHTSYVSRFRESVRAASWTLFAIVLACAAGDAVSVGDGALIAARRDAHVRELTQCGRTKACLRKRAAVSRAKAIVHDQLPAPAPIRRRWTEEEFDDVAVWIEPGNHVTPWRDANPRMIRRAFRTWSAAGAPVRFRFVDDSAHADVLVTWTDSLPEERAGQMTSLTDSRGWVKKALIEMSTRNMGGGVQDSMTVRSVALHEIGHLLGLEHSANEHDIMAAWVTATSLTRDDRAAMRALYGPDARPLAVSGY